MSEYTVGSLADLISGKNTPHKPHVIRKEFVPLPPTPAELRKNKKAIDNKSKNESNDFDESTKKKKKRKNVEEISDIVSSESTKIKKKKKLENKPTNDSDNTEDMEAIPKKKKKKKADAVIDNESNEDEVNDTEDNIEDDSDTDSDDDETKIKSGILNNASKRILAKKTKEKYAEKDVLHEKNRDRTIFVGNVNIKTNRNKLKKFFAKYGKVETVRLRCVPLANMQEAKKVAVIKKQFHPDRHSLNAYVRFVNDEDATKALDANGKEVDGHHIRVDRAGGSPADTKRDEGKAIFVGNLNFKSEEEDLWKLFSNCGEIKSVRIIRDRATNISKCFGYVNFVNADSVSVALTEPFTLHERELRINKCDINHAKKEKRRNKTMKKKERKRDKKDDVQVPDEVKKIKKSKESFDKTNNEDDGDNHNSYKSFQGIRRAEKKKKNKVNRGVQIKKAIAKKIAPKSST